jgi:hypothetical protein
MGYWNISMGFCAVLLILMEFLNDYIWIIAIRVDL